jgi:hypothetical protein
MSEGPGSYRATGRRQTLPGRQDALTGPTPPPPSSGAHLERAVPPGIDKGTAAWLEGILIEQVAMLGASIEKTNSLKVESRALAELSGKLLKAEETTADEQRRANRNKSLAMTFGAAFGSAVLAFVVKWTAYNDTAEVASKAAVQTASEVVEQKAVPIEVKATASDIRITALEQQGQAIDGRLTGIESTLVAIQQSLEQPTTVRVPKGKPR